MVPKRALMYEIRNKKMIEDVDIITTGITHQRNLIYEYTEHIHVLELQAARLGDNASPHIINSIKYTHIKIDSCQKELNRLIDQLDKLKQQQFITIEEQKFAELADRLAEIEHQYMEQLNQKLMILEQEGKENLMQEFIAEKNVLIQRLHEEENMYRELLERKKSKLEKQYLTNLPMINNGLRKLLLNEVKNIDSASSLLVDPTLIGSGSRIKQGIKQLYKYLSLEDLVMCPVCEEITNEHGRNCYHCNTIL
jgi:hypothetical protein